MVQFSKSFSILLVCVAFIFAGEWISFQSGRAAPDLSYRAVSVDKSGTNPQCKIDLSIPGAFVTYPNDNGLLAGKYASLSFSTGSAMVMNYNINGTYRPEKQGEPELPFVRIQVKIPVSVTKFKVSVANTKFVSLEGRYTVAPVQEQLFESFIAGVHADNRTFQKNEKIYSTDVYFSHGVEYETFFCNSYQVLEIRYCPLRFNPVTQSLLATNTAEIVVTYLDGQVTESNKTTVFTDIINRTSFDGINGCVNKIKNPVRGGKVVVVSHSTLMNTDTYKNWKAYREAQGYEFVKEINASGQNASAIESSIKSQWSSGRFEYLAIVGDWNLVPIPTNGSSYHWKDYSLLQGSDKVPDVCMGILLADNETKLGYIFDRQKKQEAGGTWSKTIIMTADLEDSGNNWNRFSSAHYVTRNMDKPNGGLGYKVNRVYQGSHTNYTSYGGGYGVPRTNFESWALNPNPFVTSSNNLRNKVYNWWNSEGQVIVGHRDHGSTSGPVPMTYAMFNGSITGDCSPLFTSLNCTSGNVKSTTRNFAYMSQTKKIGTCATIAATKTTMSGDNDYNHIAMYGAMFPDDGSTPERNIGKVFLAGMKAARDHGRTYFHVWGDAMTTLALGDNKPFVTLTAPMGGEEVEQNTTYTILWSDNISGNVKIELLKAGNVIAELAASTASDGSHEWQVGNTAEGTDYKVKITSIDDPSLTHQSANNFSIVGEFIVAIPYFEPFDTLDKGTEILPYKYAQLTTDDNNWTVYSGPTPSRIDEPPDVTGPMADHTTGSEQGMYIYTEASASNGGNPNKKFDYITPKFNLMTVPNPIISFWGHMFSDNAGVDNMGSLNLDISVGGTWSNDVLKVSGNQGDKWFEKTLDLTSYKNERVIFRFRGITGDGWESDICIDDIYIGPPTAINSDANKVMTSLDMRILGSKLKFFIPSKMASSVSIKLYNVQGKMVKTLVDGSAKAGYHMLSLNDKIAAGMYLCRMEAKGFTKTINVILTK